MPTSASEWVNERRSNWMAPIKRFSVSQVMLPGWYSTFEEDVAACSAAGFGGIGLWAPKLGDGRDEELNQLLRRGGLTPSVCELQVVSPLPEPWYEGPSDPGERITAMCQGVERLARFCP